MRRVISFALVMGALLAVAAFAQTPTPPPRQTPPPPAAPAGGEGAEGKIAIINTSAFRTGINELKAQLEVLNKEFEPKNRELTELQKQIEELNNKMQTQRLTVQPAVLNQWVEQKAELEKTFKRRQEDYQAEFQKRGQQLTGPIYDRLGEFLGRYAEKNGIVLVVEAVAAQQAGLLVYAAAATDITEDFMKEYNKLYPASASAR